MEKDGRRLTEGPYPKGAGKSLLNVSPARRGRRLVDEVVETHLSFSFSFFRQISFFGIREQDNCWFVSLLDRLKDLSGKDSSIMGDKNAKKAYRIHPINWAQTNIPIKKQDLSWVPKEYLTNEEIEFLQVEITKSNGRIIGFFNETNEVFNIVLLDPKHNIQPTKNTGYRVDRTSLGLTDYQQLLAQMKDMRVDEKHKFRADQMVCIDDELLALFYEYGSSSIQSDLEEFLMGKYLA